MSLNNLSCCFIQVFKKVIQPEQIYSGSQVIKDNVTENKHGMVGIIRISNNDARFSASRHSRRPDVVRIDCDGTSGINKLFRQCRIVTRNHCKQDPAVPVPNDSSTVRAIIHTK